MSLKGGWELVGPLSKIIFPSFIPWWPGEWALWPPSVPSREYTWSSLAIEEFTFLPTHTMQSHEACFVLRKCERETCWWLFGRMFNAWFIKLLLPLPQWSLAMNSDRATSSMAPGSAGLWWTIWPKPNMKLYGAKPLRQHHLPSRSSSKKLVSCYTVLTERCSEGRRLIFCRLSVCGVLGGY